MKLKDIKLETLRIMGVTAVINDEDLTRLAADEECKDYMAYMPGAINRCFSNLEGRDVLPIKRAVLSPFSGESYGGGVRYELPQAVPDLIFYNYFQKMYISTCNYLTLRDFHPQIQN